MGGQQVASDFLGRSTDNRPEGAISADAVEASSEVLRVANTGTSVAVLALAALLAAFAAFLAVTPLAERLPSLADPTRALMAGLAVWAIAFWWLARRAFGLSAVLRRSCGLGAWQWLLVVLLHEPVASASMGVRVGTSATSWASGLMPVLAGGLGIGMLWVCAVGYVWLWRRRQARLQAAPGIQK